MHVIVGRWWVVGCCARKHEHVWEGGYLWGHLWSEPLGATKRYFSTVLTMHPPPPPPPHPPQHTHTHTQTVLHVGVLPYIIAERISARHWIGDLFLRNMSCSGMLIGMLWVSCRSNLPRGLNGTRSTNFRLRSVDEHAVPPRSCRAICTYGVQQSVRSTTVYTATPQ